MKLQFPIFLLALLGGAKSFRKLTSEENQYLQSVCGLKPFYSVAKPSGIPSNNYRRSLYGGNSISGDKAPWAVQIVVDDDGKCSGTLISSRHVLTAAHCVLKDNFEKSSWIPYSQKECDGNNLILTQNNDLWKVYGSDGRLLSSKVLKMVLFNYCTEAHWRYDDIMIWELEEDAVLDDFVHPACVLANWQYATTRNLYLTGFGHNSWYYKNDDGKGTYELRDGFMTYTSYQNDRRTLMLSGEEQKVAPRPRDSGSGAFITYNSRFYVLGVCSGGENLWAMYTSVVYHYDQICHYTGVCWL